MNGDEKIEAFLNRVRSGLRGMNAEDAREIVAELRSHIRDKAAVGGETDDVTIAAALAALGSPEELASQYITEHMMARAEVSRSPFRILHSLFRWASLSLAGFFAFLATLVGYFLGLAFLLCALLKPLHPRTAGLWLIPSGTGDVTFSLRLGFGSIPADGRELLGWWVVLIGLVVGCGLLMLTTRFALWCVRLYRKSRVLPPR